MTPIIFEPVNYDRCSTTIGNCVKIWQFTTIEDDVTLGDNVVVGSNCWIGRGTVIGEGTHIQHGAFIARRSRIGKNVFIGPGAVLTDDRYPRAGNTRYEAVPPTLEDGCSIGAGAVILPGVIIGKDALVGAGAVVTENVLVGSTVMNIPAKIKYTTRSFYHD